MVDLLKNAYNNCKVEEWLEWNDNRYVKLTELGLRGTDPNCLDFLETTITMSDEATHQLFSGFIGSGKTTELKQLAHRLEQKHYTVVFVDTEDYLNLRVPATITDLWITIAAGVDRFLGQKNGHPRFWEKFHKFLTTTKVDVNKLTVGIPECTQLEMTFKKDADFKRKLDDALEGRRPELLQECRNFLEEGIAKITKDFYSQGTVLILDSFEKLRGDLHNAERVVQSVETIFIRDWKHLRTPCHAIYTVPPWMIFMEAGAASEFGRIHVLPMCKVYDPETGNPYQKGVDGMLDILAKRMDVDAIFGNRSALVPLVTASGGYTRDLLRMVREVLARGNGRGDPPDLEFPAVPVYRPYPTGVRRAVRYGPQ